MGESESEIISALALEHDENEEYCAPLTMSTQCGEVEEGAKPEPGKSNEEEEDERINNPSPLPEVDEMAQKEEIKWANETTSVIPDISMLPRKGEYMQWWPIPSLRSTQEGEDSMGTDAMRSTANNMNNSTPYTIDDPPRTVCMTFKANCSQDLIVALSPVPRTQNPLLEFRIGDYGNTSAVLRLKQHDDPDAFVSCIPCSGSRLISYWVIHWPGHVSLGVGGEPGCGTLLVYDNSCASDLMRFGQCTPNYFSFSCLRHPAEIVDIEVRVFNGVAALDIEPPNEAFYVAPGCLDALGGADKKLVEKGLSKFMEEAKRQKKRAERFQKNYSPPSLESFLPYTLVKRLSNHRGTPQGGIDTLSRDERNKALERAKRFGLSLPQKSPSIADVAMELDGGREVEKERRLSRGNRFGTGDISWMARLDEVGLTPKDVFVGDPDRWDPVEGATIIPEKIHVFVLDKRAAKMIRWNDLRAYFLRFGPREVEWLTDWSFNIVLQDKEDAEAALQELSYALPSPPPTEFPLVLEKEENRLGGASSVDGCRGIAQKPDDENSSDGPEVLAKREDDHHQHSTTTTKIEEDKVEEGLQGGELEKSEQVLGKEAAAAADKSSLSCKWDVGGMGWRLGRLLTKINSDRFGHKGAWVRVLLRTATEDDMLEDRPQHPKQFIGPIPTRGKLPPASATRRIGGTKDNESIRGSSSFGRDNNMKRRRTPSEEVEEEVVVIDEEIPSKKTRVIYEDS